MDPRRWHRGNSVREIDNAPEADKDTESKLAKLERVTEQLTLVCAQCVDQLQQLEQEKSEKSGRGCFSWLRSNKKKRKSKVRLGTSDVQEFAADQTDDNSGHLDFEDHEEAGLIERGCSLDTWEQELEAREAALQEREARVAPEGPAAQKGSSDEVKELQERCNAVETERSSLATSLDRVRAQLHEKAGMVAALEARLKETERSGASPKAARWEQAQSEQKELLLQARVAGLAAEKEEALRAAEVTEARNSELERRVRHFEEKLRTFKAEPAGAIPRLQLGHGNVLSPTAVQNQADLGSSRTHDVSPNRRSNPMSPASPRVAEVELESAWARYKEFESNYSQNLGAFAPPISARTMRQRVGEVSSQLKGVNVGDRVKVRDEGELEWKRGVVTGLSPLKVLPDGWNGEGFPWLMVERD